MLGHSIALEGEEDQTVYLLAKEQFGFGMSEKIECLLLGEAGEEGNERGLKIVNLGR